MLSEQNYNTYLQNSAGLVPSELLGAYGDIYNYNNLMSGMVTPMAMGQMANLLSGNYMDASMNPYIQGIINSSRNVAQDFYNNQSESALSALAASGNRTGGSAAINAQSTIASQLANQLAQTTAQTGLSGYNTGFQGMMSALQPALNYPAANASYLGQLYALQQQSLTDPLSNWANWNLQGMAAVNPNTVVQNVGSNPWSQAASSLANLSGTLGQFNNMGGGNMNTTGYWNAYPSSSYNWMQPQYASPNPTAGGSYGGDYPGWSSGYMW